MAGTIPNRPASTPGGAPGNIPGMTDTPRVVILGAAGKDFHTFNTCYRDNEQAQVVAFTATQIPNIDDRRYPASLSGPLYPQGVPIVPEENLEDVIQEHGATLCVMAYSDVSMGHVEELSGRCEAAGARLEPFDVDATMIRSNRPVVAITAVRTGCGKSQTTRAVAAYLRDQGLRVTAIRHPMPYGDLAAQAVQRFAELDDLAKHDCTIEEIEEYEPHIAAGGVVYAGVDYAAILAEAEAESDIILWDGGNNDTPFYRPDVWITVADPHRAGHETSYFPGNVNFDRCDVILIGKMDTAPDGGAAAIRATAAERNPGATVMEADSPPVCADPSVIEGKRVLVVEDGPTCTHGGMAFGAGTVAAKAAGASELVDPRPWLTGTLKGTFESYPEIGCLLPAMGYGDEQIADLQATINAVDCDAVVIGTPIDLGRIVQIDRPHVRVTYDLAERGEPGLAQILAPVCP